MDSNGFKAMAFLHFYLCGVVAAFSGLNGGHAAFATIIASTVLLTSGVLSALWMLERRQSGAASERGPEGFGPGAGRAAVWVGWASLGFSLALQSHYIVYAGYIAVLVLLLYRARSMAQDEKSRSGFRAKLRLES